MRTGLLVILLLGGSTVVTAAEQSASGDSDQPSRGLLEFLSELDPVDEETWALLEQNALKDVADKDEVNSE